MTNPASPRPPKRPKSSGDPTLIRCGSVAVKIYKLSREKGAYFTVSWHTGPKRNRQNFKAFEAAKKFARDRAEELAAGQANSPTVTIAQAQDMKEALRRIGLLGTPVHVVAGEYADVVNQLGGTGTLRQAVEFFLHNSIRSEMQRTVAQVAEEFVSSKKANGCSRPYIEDCTWRLRRFAADFQMSIAHICTRDIEDWLCKRSTSLVTRNDFRRLIITLFNFARRRSYASYRLAMIEDVAKVSLEMGNSPQKIFSNYRKVVTKSQAAAWFAIMPDMPENVVPIGAAA